MLRHVIVRSIELMRLCSEHCSVHATVGEPRDKEVRDV